MHTYTHTPLMYAQTRAGVAPEHGDVIFGVVQQLHACNVKTTVRYTLWYGTVRGGTGRDGTGRDRRDETGRAAEGREMAIVTSQS